MREIAGRWLKEFKLAGRGLSRAPGFATVAIVTLALGMGGSTALYTLLDRIVLNPLPYPEPERLVRLDNQVPGVGPDTVWAMSTAQYVYFGAHADSFESLGLYRGMGANIETPEGPQRAFGWLVTASLFPMMGARAQVGRLIDAHDDSPEGDFVVVLSNGFWRRQFASDDGVIGRTIQIDGRPFEVIGVLAAGLSMPGTPPDLTADLWVPLRINREGPFQNNHVFPMLGRLAAGVDRATAEAELTSLTANLPDQFPNAYTQAFFDRYGFRTRVTTLQEAVVGDASQSLWVLFGAVGVVLLIACANVANLMVVRLDGRRRELAVRWALGAGRGALARHLLAEGLVLAGSGGILALAFGTWGVPALVAIAPDSLPRLDEVGINGASVLFVLVMSLLVGVALAAYPLFRDTRTVNSASLAGGRTATDNRERQRLRSLLVVAQVAMALTLVVGAGLLIESMRRLRSEDPGFDPIGVLTAEIFLTPGRQATDTELWQTYAEILERVEAIPGVTAAGMSEELPLSGGFGCTVQGFEDPSVYQRLESAGMTTCAGPEATTPGYFAALGIPVLRGRAFTASDNDDPIAASVVVSRAFADRFWPGQEAIGKGVATGGRSEGPFNRVVGVVGDVPADTLGGEPAIAIYYPIAQSPEVPAGWSRWWRPTQMSLVVRTGLADPPAILDQVRAAVAQVDPAIAIAGAVTMDERLAESTARFRFSSALLSIAAGVALILAAVGLYGVVSYLVGTRTREIGMRIAVGAQPREVVRLFLGRSLILVVAGLAIGGVTAFASTRLLAGMLYGVEPSDPSTFVMATGLLLVVGAAAAWIPARRAARANPVDALRAD